ncbi:MAG: glycosyltransferase [Ignavibacteriaceae bacterium]|nr:glycosyltransferase [Ignavibacteriaceae bacterium]
MKFSIIIPTLNEEILLPNLLGQLTEENIRNKFDFEIIISDGGSKDNTLEIAKKFTNKILSNNENTKQNIAIGRNTGAKNASGDLLIFLNGDVVINDPYYFFNFLNDSFHKSDYLAFTCDVWIYPKEEILSDRIFHTIYNTYFRLLNYAGVGMGRGECQVIRKSVFDRIGGYNEQCAAGEDFELFKRIRKLGKILYSKSIFVYESPRRFRKLGYFMVTFSWIANSFSVMFLKRSLHSEWEQIR